MRAGGTPRAPGRSRLGQQSSAAGSPLRPTPRAACHPKVKRSVRNGNENPHPAGGPRRPRLRCRPREASWSRRHRRPVAAAAGLRVPPAPPRGPEGTSERPSDTRAPAHPDRAPRALPPHLPPLILSGRRAGRAGARRNGRGASSSAQRLSPVAAAEPPASQLRDLRGPLPPAASARAGAGPHAGRRARARSAGARAARRPRPRPRARASGGYWGENEIGGGRGVRSCAFRLSPGAS